MDNLSKPDTILVGTFMQHGLDPTKYSIILGFQVSQTIP